MRTLYQAGEANFPRLKTDTLWIDPSNRYSYRGIIDITAKYIEEIQLLREELWARFVDQFGRDADMGKGWRGEYWGKMMRGACFVYSYTQNAALYRTLEKTVLDLLEKQEENGRISTYGSERELNYWDLWCRKYVLLGMQYFMEICKDKALAQRILQSMRRQVDYIMEYIGEEKDGKCPITLASHHWRGLNSSSILEPVVRLYSLTDEQKYLDFASYIVDQGATDVENIFTLAYENKLAPYQYPVTKAYEMTSCFEGLLEYYRVTGIEKHKAAVINFANRVLETDVTVIGCCGCTHELFDHSAVRQANTDNGERMQETCVTVTLMKFFSQLAMLTGDSKYIDAFETSLYNAYLGAVNTEQVIEPTIREQHPDWSIEPLPFDSYSPLTAGTRGNGVGGLLVMSDNHYYGCCACIGAAGIGLASMISCMSHAKGLAINLYADGQIQTKTPSGAPATLHIDTDYPKSGSIKISVDLQTSEHFELSLRIPAWSENTTLSVNGQSIPVQVGYTVISRTWSAGDTMELTLDMRTRVLRPTPYGHQVLMNKVVWGHNYVVPAYDEEDPLAHRHVALVRGPIVLAQENRLGYSVDEPVEISMEKDIVNAVFPTEEIAPYPHILEMEIPLTNGTHMHVTDYASAGKLWTKESKMAAWMLIK